jgi:polysaccharide chain length determinant protein (PEP-CTERM system associated)
VPEKEESLGETLSKLMKIVVRRRWWILLPASLIAVGAGVTSLMIPDRYESEATILVERQQVPERYVTANTTSDLQEVLMGMTDAILSRTQLLQIIDEFHLYSQDRGHMAPEQLVDLMRNNIKIEPIKNDSDPNDLHAFTISFAAHDPHAAQKVATRLTKLFIEESDRSREEQSAETTDFLSDTLTVAAEELKQQEERVREFKMSALGELPEQQQGNLAILAGLHQELQNTTSNLGRAHEQQTYLQSLLSQYQALAASGAAGLEPTQTSPQDTIKAQLARLQEQRAELLARFTDKYPDVVKVDQQIKETEALLAASKPASEDPKTEAGQRSSHPSRPTEANATIAQVKSQLEANQIEIENATADQKRIEDSIADYQRRLNLTPVREQQLADILRGYDQSKRHYDDLLSKKNQSELATNLERRQQGQRFNIIDPPSLPMKPVSPNHLKISLGGLLAGILVGAALAMVVEERDHSLIDEHDLRSSFSFPLMLGLPLLLSGPELRKRSRNAALEWVLGTFLCLLVCVTEYYVYRRG